MKVTIHGCDFDVDFTEEMEIFWECLKCGFYFDDVKQINNHALRHLEDNNEKV